LYFNYSIYYHHGIDVPVILAAGLRITLQIFPLVPPVPPAIPIEELYAEDPVSDAVDEDYDNYYNSDHVVEDDEVSICIVV